MISTSKPPAPSATILPECRWPADDTRCSASSSWPLPRLTVAVKSPVSWRGVGVGEMVDRSGNGRAAFAGAIGAGYLDGKAWPSRASGASN